MKKFCILYMIVSVFANEMEYWSFSAEQDDEGENSLSGGNEDKKELKELDIKQFKAKLPWYRPKQKFAEVNVGLDKDQDGMKIMAFGFIDNDKFNDIVTVNQK